MKNTYIWNLKPDNMVNPVLAEMDKQGEKHLKKWITDNGYTELAREQLQSNDIGYAANGVIENILVQVKTFIFPNRPFKLSEFEVDLLTRRATKLGRVAYVAYITMNPEGELVGEIYWERHK